MSRNRGNLYQWFLIVLGLSATALFGVFLYREIFPEYRIYQKDYVALEEFRASYSGQPVPAFKEGVKQIVIERADKGPPLIDRCTSCHVALQFEHFSKTKIGKDINGNILLDPDGMPVKVPNENYVFAKLDQKINELKDPAVLKNLEKEGNYSEVKNRLKEAQALESLKTAKVDGKTYQIDKVLSMHPLIGREVRPFEFHPIEEYGCTSCHNGNGRGLTTEKAHGPVFDGQYDPSHSGIKPRFLESDLGNDPKFATVFNNRPDDSLLFMTTPLFVGGVIEAKCVQCHKTSLDTLQGAFDTTEHLLNKRSGQKDAVYKSYQEEIQAFTKLVDLKASLAKVGIEKTKASLQDLIKSETLGDKELSEAQANLNFLRAFTKTEDAEKEIDERLAKQINNPKLLAQLILDLKDKSPAEKTKIVEKFLNKNLNDNSRGLLFAKLAALNIEEDLLKHVIQSTSKIGSFVQNERTINSLENSVDLLTKTYAKGRSLFVSQGCYACHRIAGLSRSGVGPELTYEGSKYPWFVKESIVWPQADLPTSTMPNMRMDHEELEALTTFLLAQTGKRKHESDTDYKVQIQEWESGKKKAWEMAVTPDQIDSIDFGMTVFATEGCAACHRLKGFESHVGFTAQKEDDKDLLDSQIMRFRTLFPEDLAGSEIVLSLENHQKEIDSLLIDNAKPFGILDRIENSHPGIISSFYSNFKYADRSKNSFFKEKIANSKNDKEREIWELRKKNWHKRVNRVLLAYIEQYGLGRLIGPRPNWSGIYRTDEWLMAHFKNPSAEIARSIMPVFPFDDTKFYALTKMLDVLAIRNRDEVHRIWEANGFNPEVAYEIHCAQCHGPYLQGNGPVSAWIYPIPKNLRNPIFLKNLTREQALQSIVHGVHGTPMPPWGEVASDKPNDGVPVLSQNQAKQLVDWLFSTLSGGRSLREDGEVLKWEYGPEDVIKDLKREGRPLKGKKPEKKPQPLSINKAGFDFNFLSLIQTGLKNDLENDPALVFDIKKPLPGSNEPHAYYIKKEFYTKENLDEGMRVFNLNCAVCHGKDADGRGTRSVAMEEAKPRMLTNLNWIESRDDLRLLRSIKFGVPGTSMTPWGDQTSSLQRLQLVMYIRSLSQEAKQRQKLTRLIYEIYDSPILATEEVRSKEYPLLEEGKAKKELASQEIQKILSDIANGKENKQALVEAYEKELELTKENQLFDQKDKVFKKFIENLKKEKKAVNELGLQLISLNNTELSHEYFNWLETYRGRYQFKEKTLFITEEKPSLKKDESEDIIISGIDKEISNLEIELKAEQGRLRSPLQEERMQEINAKISQIKKLKLRILTTFRDISELESDQRKLIESITP